MRINLDHNAEVALTSALENYLSGVGIQDDDEDEAVLEGLLESLLA